MTTSRESSSFGALLKRQRLARGLSQEALALARLAGDRAVAMTCLEGLASVAWTRGHLEHAARLHGAAATLRRGTFVLYVWDERVARDRQVAAVRTALGEEAFAAAWAAGQSMTLEEATALALEGLLP
jgi:hypothetical protein